MIRGSQEQHPDTASFCCMSHWKCKENNIPATKTHQLTNITKNHIEKTTTPARNKTSARKKTAPPTTTLLIKQKHNPPTQSAAPRLTAARPQSPLQPPKENDISTKPRAAAQTPEKLHKEITATP